jgi:hypothetical protein
MIRDQSLSLPISLLIGGRRRFERRYTMKNRFAIIPLIILVTVLWGCGGEDTRPDISDGSAHVARTVNILAEAKSIEYTYIYEELYQNDGKEFGTQTTAENIRIFEPYAYWVKNDTVNHDNNDEPYRSVVEIYQLVQEGRYDFYFRSSDQETDLNAVPSLGEWDLDSTEDKEAVDMLIRWDKDTREAQLYLLRANADSFRFVEDAEAGGETVLKYSGSISPASAIEAYKVYLRDRYVEMGLLKELDNPSPEELKDEIVNGDVLEIKVGIPALAYSEEPVPISLWIDKDTFTLQKVEVDKAVVMGPLLEKQLAQAGLGNYSPVITKALVTYVITGIDTAKKPPIPQI